MALQTSGAISLNDIHVEAGGGSGTTASINDADIRDLIGKGSGATMSFSEWYGASAAGLLAKDSSYGTAGVVAVTGSLNSQSAIDIFWRRTSATSAAISVTGYISNAVHSITRYNVDGSTTTLTANRDTYLDLAKFSSSSSSDFDGAYKIIEISESTVSGSGSSFRQTIEFPTATYDMANNTNYTLSSGETAGYREMIFTSNSSNVFHREYTVDFYLGGVKQYGFIIGVKYDP